MYGEPSLNFIEQECPYVLSDGTAPRTAGQTFNIHVHAPCIMYIIMIDRLLWHHQSVYAERGYEHLP